MDTTALLIEIVAGIVISGITGIVAGNLSSQKTISALIVHIDYLRSDIKRHDEAFSKMEQAVLRAHERIDRIEKRAA